MEDVLVLCSFKTPWTPDNLCAPKWREDYNQKVGTTLEWSIFQSTKPFSAGSGTHKIICQNKWSQSENELIKLTLKYKAEMLTTTPWLSYEDVIKEKWGP